MHGHQTMEPAIQVRNGGIGLGDEGVRDHLLGVIRELLTNYDTEGIELDLAAPGGTAFHFPVDQGPEYAPLLTEYLAGSAAIARSRKGKPALLGVRVYPTEAMNQRHGMDVHTWLAEGIVATAARRAAAGDRAPRPRQSVGRQKTARWRRAAERRELLRRVRACSRTAAAVSSSRRSRMYCV